MNLFEMIHRETYRFLAKYSKREDMELFLRRNRIHYKVMETLIKGGTEYYTLFEVYSAGNLIPSMKLIQHELENYQR